MRSWGEPSVLEMLRTIAVARLILGGEQNIQAPPNLTPDAYGMYLLAGINDWGGISPVTLDHINPERAWPMIRELRETTAEAGFELRERTCLYPEYLARPSSCGTGCAPPRVADRRERHRQRRRNAGSSEAGMVARQTDGRAATMLSGGTIGCEIGSQ